MLHVILGVYESLVFRLLQICLFTGGRKSTTKGKYRTRLFNLLPALQSFLRKFFIVVLIISVSFVHTQKQNSFGNLVFYCPSILNFHLSNYALNMSIQI